MIQSTATNELHEDEDIIEESLAFERALRSDLPESESATVPESATSARTITAAPFRLVPLRLDGNTFRGTHETAALLAEIGGIMFAVPDYIFDILLTLLMIQEVRPCWR